MRKLRLLAALLAMVAVLSIGASGPAMAQSWWADDSDSWGGWYDPYDDYGPYGYWWGDDDVTDVDWEYEPGYGWYPEEVAWEDDGYAYEVEYVPCDGDDLCVDDLDRDSL